MGPEWCQRNLTATSTADSQDMKGNVIVGQSGGPTAAINASLAGVYRTAKDRGANKVYGMLHGIQGLLKEKYIDLSDHIKTELDAELLKKNTGRIFGILTVISFRRSMRTEKCMIRYLRSWTNWISKYLSISVEMILWIQSRNYRIMPLYSVMQSAFIGCPKTIDNDLALTDHTPGYGSAAKYIGTSMKRDYP
mgnify:CR=1 FL=1